MQHCRRSVQQIHLVVRNPTSLRRFDFSPADRYSGLRKLEVRQLARTLLPPASGRNLEALKEKINSYTRGQLPHAKHVISALYELMESDEPVEEIPLPVPTSSNQQASSRNWAGLKKALTSSLTSGTFLDSQFYAVESRSSTGLPKIRPMYFCSMVDDSLASKLMTCKPLTLVVCEWVAKPPS